MVTPLQRRLLVTLLVTAPLLGAACATAEPYGDDGPGASEDAIITNTEKALGGASYRGDPNGPILGLITKHPTRNFAFEKEVVFTLEVDPAKFPGLCPPASPGSICLGARIEGQLSATATVLTLKATDPIAPQLQPLMGRYRYTLTPTGLTLTKVGAPSVVHTLQKGSFCSMPFDCTTVEADTSCLVEAECTAQRTCKLTKSDPTCDPSFRSVSDLSDVRGTWTATGAGAATATYKTLVMTRTSVNQSISEGTFVGKPAAGPDTTGTYRTMPENPAVGFAFISFASGGAPAGSLPEMLIVGGVRLGADGKVVAMKVNKMGQVGPVGTGFIYEKSP